MDTLRDYQNTKAADYKNLEVSSEAFLHNEPIPSRYTCEGININPVLHIDHIPKEATSLAIIVDDPDAPNGNFCHWVIWNIPVTHLIKENESRGTSGMNDFSEQGYNGPCPPSGTHRYYFKVYALDISLDLPDTANKEQLEKAMVDHIIGFGIMAGLYQRQ